MNDIYVNYDQFEFSKVQFGAIDTQEKTGNDGKTYSYSTIPISYDYEGNVGIADLCIRFPRLTSKYGISYNQYSEKTFKDKDGNEVTTKVGQINAQFTRGNDEIDKLYTALCELWFACSMKASETRKGLAKVKNVEQLLEMLGDIFETFQPPWYVPSQGKPGSKKMIEGKTPSVYLPVYQSMKFYQPDGETTIPQELLINTSLDFQPVVKYSRIGISTLNVKIKYSLADCVIYGVNPVDVQSSQLGDIKKSLGDEEHAKLISNFKNNLAGLLKVKKEQKKDVEVEQHLEKNDSHHEEEDGGDNGDEGEL